MINSLNEHVPSTNQDPKLMEPFTNSEIKKLKSMSNSAPGKIRSITAILSWLILIVRCYKFSSVDVLLKRKFLTSGNMQQQS